MRISDWSSDVCSSDLGRRHDIETSGSTGRAVRMLGTEMTGVFWRACVMREHFWHRRNVGGKLAAIRWARKGVAMAPDGMRRDSWGPASGSIYPTGPAVLLNIVSSLQQQVDWLQREQPDYRSEEHTSELQSLM